VNAVAEKHGFAEGKPHPKVRCEEGDFNAGSSAVWDFYNVFYIFTFDFQSSPFSNFVQIVSFTSTLKFISFS
jgi:hypothetical protein